ncbi:hypothetical protein NM04_13835 [Massilia aurea]|uniref:Uncharacterized protein n=2 Tax=Massilia aurea TaxID=373040 RepID=A0A422QJN7_9BURK|nr:hypothetical protein NM04_13835 [Massilia aurea]
MKLRPATGNTNRIDATIKMLAERCDEFINLLMRMPDLTTSANKLKPTMLVAMAEISRDMLVEHTLPGLARTIARTGL